MLRLMSKACTRCREVKPLERFHRRTFKSGTKGYTSECKVCRVALRQALSRTERGRENNRRNAKKYYGKLRQWREASKLMIGRAPEGVDVLRRAIVDRPPEIRSEEGMAAYFRGFVAGAKRSAHESARFESLKDLIHRIAAEQSRKVHALLYEDALSYAYAAALNYLRKATPEDEAHFRKKAAVAIRNGIVDGVREHPTRMIIGKRRHLFSRRRQPVKFGNQFAVDDDGSTIEKHLASQDAPGDEIAPDLLSSVEGLKPRERVILEWLAQGLTQKEVGERLGLTETRICQIVRRVRERHGEKLLAALAS